MQQNTFVAEITHSDDNEVQPAPSVSEVTSRAVRCHLQQKFERKRNRKHLVEVIEQRLPRLHLLFLHVLIFNRLCIKQKAHFLKGFLVCIRCSSDTAADV